MFFSFLLWIVPCCRFQSKRYSEYGLCCEHGALGGLFNIVLSISFGLKLGVSSTAWSDTGYYL